MDIMRTHPMVVIGGILQENPFFVPPDEMLRELRERAATTRPAAALTMSTSEKLAEENRTLCRAMRDLVGLSVLPAVWSGYTPEGIAASLADVLLTTLSLDLVYVR